MLPLSVVSVIISGLEMFEIIQALSTSLKTENLILAVVKYHCVVFFGIHGHAEIFFHFLARKDVCHEVIIYIDAHREDVQGAPHGVVHLTYIIVNTEVLFQWAHSDV